MSAVSKNVIPESRAAATTALVWSASIRMPKLLQPSPTRLTVSEPMVRVSMLRTLRKLAEIGPDRRPRAVGLAHRDRLTESLLVHQVVHRVQPGHGAAAAEELVELQRAEADGDHSGVGTSVSIAPLP